MAGDLEEVVLTSRHEGEPLPPAARSFPCFVFVCRPLVDDVQGRDAIDKDEVEIIGWGELYRTRSDADNHVFDPTGT
jgi:hypothetical protein